jgi:hypothetical protein
MLSLSAVMLSVRALFMLQKKNDFRFFRPNLCAKQSFGAGVRSVSPKAKAHSDLWFFVKTSEWDLFFTFAKKERT